MKKNLCLVGLLACCLASCSPVSEAGDKQGQIDVLPAIGNLTELKVSQLGKNIRYVPLETTDSSLIGRTCKIKLLEDKILVNTSASPTDVHCYLFDRKTGKFIREVGHKGQDPRGYSELISYIHPVTGDIYFHRAPDKLVKYNQDGEFLGEVELPGRLSSGFYSLLTEDGMVVYQGDAFNAMQESRLYQLDASGVQKMDVNLNKVTTSKAVNPNELAGLTIVTGNEVVGLLGYTGAIKISYKNGEQNLFAFNYPALWQLKDGIRFHEVFGDTIFTIKDASLEPYRVFNLGDRRLAVEDRGKQEGFEEHLTITYVLETEELIYFQCAKNLYGEYTVYNGIYRKSDGDVVMNLCSEAFTDDLTGFLPFRPVAHTVKGEFAGVLRVEDIQNWIEEHPEVALEGALAPLKGLDYDANQVVVIVEP